MCVCVTKKNMPFTHEEQIRLMLLVLAHGWHPRLLDEAFPHKTRRSTRRAWLRILSRPLPRVCTDTHGVLLALVASA